jgi:D-3-phosphoglycerate dehydrogenase
MKKGAFFINIGRGMTTKLDDLVASLRSHHLAGAGLDVWEAEPPDPAHPLLQFDNVLASPHTAGVTRESRDTMARMTAEQLLDILDGKRPPRLINPEVWPAYCDRFERIIGTRPQG